MKKISLMLVVVFVFAVVTCTSGVASAYLSTEYVGNTIVDLSWDEYEDTDFSKYELCRDGVPIKTITDRTDTFYRDAGLIKGVNYGYEIHVYNVAGVLVLRETRTTSATTGEVHGTITQDTTWTTASSPYTLARDVDVRNGATLTIACGVLINTSGYPGISVQEKGALYADGASFCNVSIKVDDSHADIKTASLIMLISP
jgi:hypothetical protein